MTAHGFNEDAAFEQMAQRRIDSATVEFYGSDGTGGAERVTLTFQGGRQEVYEDSGEFKYDTLLDNLSELPRAVDFSGDSVSGMFVIDSRERTVTTADRPAED